MNERAKITASHLARYALVYLRQSSASQVENQSEQITGLSLDRKRAFAGRPLRDKGCRLEEAR